MWRLLLVALAITPEASALRISLEATHSRKEVTKKIWVLYEFEKPNPFVELNFDTWRKNAPEYEIMLLNNSNIEQYVPDLPKEYFHLPYASAKSDFLRAAVLYHQGGVYMDTDFLLMKPLRETLDKLQDHDIVTYRSDSPNGKSGACPQEEHKDFSSNFMAGNKGNEFSRIWYHNIKVKLTQVCEKGGMKMEKVCCHEEGEESAMKCHIPWAQLEHLKTPWKFPDDSTRGIKGDKKNKKSSLAQLDDVIKELPSSVQLYCYTGDESFTPQPSGDMFWQPWDSTSKSTLPQKEEHLDRKEYESRYNCKESEHGTLSCTKTEFDGTQKEMTMENYFGRRAYHLFSSSKQPKVVTKQDILDRDWLVSDMYHRALGI